MRNDNAKKKKQKNVENNTKSDGQPRWIGRNQRQLEQWLLEFNLV